MSASSLRSGCAREISIRTKASGVRGGGGLGQTVSECAARARQRVGAGKACQNVQRGAYICEIYELSSLAYSQYRRAAEGSGERGAGGWNDAQWQNVVNAISDSSCLLLLLLLLLVATEVGSELTEKCQLNENFHKCVCECVCQTVCASVRRMFQIELCKTRDRA